jgi:hypothetical protein
LLDLVIARYNEDMEWVSNLPSFVNPIIYNKGNDWNYGIHLPNVGREGHTFLHHITSVYDKLNCTNADHIMFVQGNPFDHFSTLMEYIEEKKYLDGDMTLLSNQVLECDLNGNPHHAGLPLSDFFDKALKCEKPDKVVFGAGGQFVIHKRFIHRKKFEHFAGLYLTSYTQPIVAYMLERTWKYVFE